jgi:O-antigen ligase
LCFAIVQISSLTPASWHSPLWQQASDTLVRGIAGAIAVDRPAGLTGLLRLLTYAGVFGLSLVLCRDSDRAWTVVRLITLSGGAYASYGLIVYWSGNETLLWLSKWTYEHDLTGTFVNRNSFATFLGLSFLTALCQLIGSFSRLQLFGSRRDKARTIIEFASARWWQFVALFLIATALVLTHSRGGFISSLVGTLIFFVALSQAPSLARFRRVGLAALPVVLVVLAFLISGGATLERLIGTTLDSEERLAVFRLIGQAIGDNPILGIGLGSFDAFFPLYRTSAIVGYYDLAHNDYLQNILELGIPAAICFFVALLWLVGLCARGMRTRRRDAVYPCLGIATSALVGLHAMVDFSLQIPAVTTLYMAILGMAVAQSRSTQEVDESRK